jgi:hypothetical protein
MPSELSLLTLTAASLGFLHTAAGPDHYVPFIAMSRLGRWPMVKTTWITLLCGLGHVLGSVVLGLAGVALGVALAKVQAIDYFRGDLAARLLTAFGLVYCVWGVRRAAVFGAGTIGTMLTLVLAAAYGGRVLPLGKLERYNHALAGAAVFLCGVSIQCLGL